MFAKKLDRRLVSLTAPTSLEAEQYQALRLKLESLHRSRGVRVMAITSPGVKDGKSVTAINLAAALAQGSGARVLLIEADLRRPAVARYLRLGEKQAPGLADIVDDPNRPLRDAIVDAGPHRFDVMFAGSTVAPIHELLRFAAARDAAPGSAGAVRLRPARHAAARPGLGLRAPRAAGPTACCWSSPRTERRASSSRGR